MTPIVLTNNKVLLVNNKVAFDINCCCGDTSTITPETVTPEPEYICYCSEQTTDCGKLFRIDWTYNDIGTPVCPDHTGSAVNNINFSDSTTIPATTLVGTNRLPGQALVVYESLPLYIDIYCYCDCDPLTNETSYVVGCRFTKRHPQIIMPQWPYYCPAFVDEYIARVPVDNNGCPVSGDVNLICRYNAPPPLFGGSPCPNRWSTAVGTII